jgi:hypothetical protein
MLGGRSDVSAKRQPRLKFQISSGKASGVSRNLFPKPVYYIDDCRSQNEFRAYLEDCTDLFTNNKMSFVLRIKAPARKLRDTEPNYLTRFER